jgi:two-component system nitrogen regulation response regulator NtrX
MAKKILIIDDESSIRDSLAGILTDEGFEAQGVESAEKGLAVLEQDFIDLVLLDIWMPGMDGMEALPRIKELYPHLPVIMISGHGNIETAVQATKMGAYDFIEKPPSYDKIILAITNAIHLSQLEKENLILREKETVKPRLTGTSPAITSLKEQIERVAPTDAWVLISGEHGTGKEVVAQTIHQLSSMADKPMIEVNCAAIPEELIESELFGHEKGSFTGANSSKRGKFDLANGGILFLDEIGDMSLKTQAKILRILQEQKFERVGGSKTIFVNVRVLAATNKDLEHEIAEGNFRADLFWRLNVVPITVPPLRERITDLPLLVADIMTTLYRKGFSRKKFTTGALDLMAQHSWPGNVREVRNFLERLAIMVGDPEITVENIKNFLPHVPGAAPADSAGRGELSHSLAEAGTMTFKDAKKYFEREFIRSQLSENKGNISQTAEKIGVERSHLHKKIKALGLEA